MKIFGVRNDEVRKESTTVAAVWDEQGNEYPEIAEALQVLLN